MVISDDEMTDDLDDELTGTALQLASLGVSDTADSASSPDPDNSPTPFEPVKLVPTFRAYPGRKRRAVQKSSDNPVSPDELQAKQSASTAPPSHRVTSAGSHVRPTPHLSLRAVSNPIPATHAAMIANDVADIRASGSATVCALHSSSSALLTSQAPPTPGPAGLHHPPAHPITAPKMLLLRATIAGLFQCPIIGLYVEFTYAAITSAVMKHIMYGD